MDYYDLLGVSRQASEKELKNAFKKKAMQYHPDKGGDPEKFKQINEAYQNLSDPQKRQMYDQFGTVNPQQQAGPQGFSFNFGGGPGGFDINDLMGQFGFNQRQMRNEDITIGCRITLREVYTGKNIIATYRLRTGQEQTVDIKLPPGVSPGDKIRYAGMGQKDIPNAPPGDLFVQIQVQNEKNWDIVNRDLLTIVEINVLELITGTTTFIQTPEGRQIKLNIPPGTQPNTVFNVTGKGLPDRRTGAHGNVHVRVNGVVPRNLDRNAINEIDRIRKESN